MLAASMAKSEEVVSGAIKPSEESVSTIKPSEERVSAVDATKSEQVREPFRQVAAGEKVVVPVCELAVKDD
jgi:hypothetical protein